MSKSLSFLIFLASALPVSSGQAANYGGSSFNQVWDIVSDKGFQPISSEEKSEFDVYKNSNLPHYPVNSVSLFSQGKGALKHDAIRTTSERFDYYDRIAKRLHANGVCVSGFWEINKTTPYSGMLATGSHGLFIGRVSVALENTEVGHNRGFGFAGKVFPTTDPNQTVVTGNFFTVDTLMGTKLTHVLDAKTTNEPKLGFDLSLLGMAFKIASALKAADVSPLFRPLTQVAAAGALKTNSVVQPKWIRLSADAKTLRNEQSDFRSEILQAVLDNKVVKYNIDVSNISGDSESSSWTSIGEINLDRAKVSYGCDRRLHFAHPKLK